MEETIPKFFDGADVKLKLGLKIKNRISPFVYTGDIEKNGPYMFRHLSRVHRFQKIDNDSQGFEELRSAGLKLDERLGRLSYYEISNGDWYTAVGQNLPKEGKSVSISDNFVRTSHVNLGTAVQCA
jgi:hypothetical protein